VHLCKSGLTCEVGRACMGTRLLISLTSQPTLDLSQESLGTRLLISLTSQPTLDLSQESLGTRLANEYVIVEVLA